MSQLPLDQYRQKWAYLTRQPALPLLASCVDCYKTRVLISKRSTAVHTLIEKALRERLSLRGIARIFGLSVQTVLLLPHVAQALPAFRFSVALAPADDVARMTIKTLARKGLTNRHIARLLGSSEGAVRYQRKRMHPQAHDSRLVAQEGSTRLALVPQ